MVALCAWISPRLKVAAGIFVGSVLAVLDLGADVFWIVELFRNDLEWWGSASFCLMLLPYVGLALYGACKEYERREETSSNRARNVLNLLLDLMFFGWTLLLDFKVLPWGLFYFCVSGESYDEVYGPHVFFRRGFFELYFEAIPQLILKILAYFLTHQAVDRNALVIALIGSLASIGWNGYKLIQFKRYSSFGFWKIGRIMVEDNDHVSSLLMEMFIMKDTPFQLEAHFDMHPSISSYRGHRSGAKYKIGFSKEHEITLHLKSSSIEVVEDICDFFAFLGNSGIKDVRSLAIHCHHNKAMTKDLAKLVLRSIEKNGMKKASLRILDWEKLNKEMFVEVLLNFGISELDYSITNESGRGELNINLNQKRKRDLSSV